MSAVSVLHAPLDEALGEKIATALSREGHATRRVGANTLEGDLALDASPAIVIWSNAAAKLVRLHDQARAALARGALIPVAIGGAAPPRGFEDLPPVDLSGWGGDGNDPRWRFVLEEINIATRNALLEDGAVWSEPGRLQAADEAESAVVRESEREPSTPPVEPPCLQVRSAASFEHQPAHIAATRQQYKFRPAHVALGGLAALFLLAVGAAFLAPRFLSGPDLVAAAPQGGDDQLGAPAETGSAQVAPATIAFVTPVEQSAKTSDFEVTVYRDPENAPAEIAVRKAPAEALSDQVESAPAAEQEAAGAQTQQSLTPPAAGEAAADLGETDHAGAGQAAPALVVADPDLVVADPDLVVADNDAMENLVAAVTSDTQIASVNMDLPALPADITERVYLGNYFKECIDCPDMAALPVGKFNMGAPPGELARRDTEGPVTEVSITERYAISTREVTFRQWDACVAGGGCKAYTPSDQGWGRADRPVVNVSFDDAQSFVAWLSAKTGQPYRLPSEAEWEYAARAGSGTALAFGDSVSTDKANYNGKYRYRGPEGVSRGRTTPVASFPPNNFGLFDMHGNAWEWTADCWTANHAGASPDGSARTGACDARVLKGGAWNTGGWRLRSAHRIAKPQSNREYDIGFRVARDLN